MNFFNHRWTQINTDNKLLGRPTKRDAKWFPKPRRVQLGNASENLCPSVFNCVHLWLRQRILAGGRQGGERRGKLDCEQDGSSWQGQFPSQSDISRAGKIAKLAANGKCVNGWAGSKFRREFRELTRIIGMAKVETQGAYDNFWPCAY
jgi:hypothetical protein